MADTVTRGACPLCAGRELAPQPRPAHTIGGTLGALPGLGVVRCRRCGFDFVDPRPADALLTAFYQAQDYTAHEPVDDAAAVRRARQQLDAITAAAGRLDGAAVLDIGCGGGQLLAQARGRGARPTGVDVAAHAHAACRALGIEVVDRVEALGGRRFDGIVMSHVLEHVPDVPATLAQCRASLAPGGWLCLEVPNIASLRARASVPAVTRLGADERYRAFPIHLSYFSPATLGRALADAGFTVAAMTTAGLGVDALVPRRDAAPPATKTASSPEPPTSPPRGLKARARAWLKHAYFGRLLGENLITIARPA